MSNAYRDWQTDEIQERGVAIVGLKEVIRQKDAENAALKAELAEYERTEPIKAGELVQLRKERAKLKAELAASQAEACRLEARVAEARAWKGASQ